MLLSCETRRGLQFARAIIAPAILAILLAATSLAQETKPDQGTPNTQVQQGTPQQTPPQQGQPAGTPADQQQKPDGIVVFLVQFAPFIFLFIVFWFIAIRPHSKQQKEKQKMLDNLQKGDEVLTSAGFYGTIDKIRDDEITVLVDDVRFRFLKQSIISVVNKKDKADEESKK